MANRTEVTQREIPAPPFPPLQVTVDIDGIPTKFQMVRYGMDYSRNSFFIQINAGAVKTNGNYVFLKTVTLHIFNEIDVEITTTEYDENNEQVGEPIVEMTLGTKFATLIKDSEINGQSLEAFVMPSIVNLFNTYVATLTDE